MHMVKIVLSNINTKQKYLGCKKGEANQKQQLFYYSYIAIYVTKNFDSYQLRPRIKYAAR